ncbi:DUF4153 domain-containing protein [uncultured Clostridium sp.]|uniref:DUF4153 domain-containing protein n=1 Tax=uncultured Clostridium sp. TaxID=59620 RepID=UPI0025CEE75A|nr:DUF4173 domain-containing protein [uncultured Clostridium sp.]
MDHEELMPKEKLAAEEELVSEEGLMPEESLMPEEDLMPEEKLVPEENVMPDKERMFKEQEPPECGTGADRPVSAVDAGEPVDVGAPVDISVPADKTVTRRREYGWNDYILALTAAFASWAYVRGAGIFPDAWLPLFTALFAFAGIFYLTSSGRKMDGEGKLYFVFMAAAAVWFLVKYLPGQQDWERQDIMPYVALFLHGAGVYWLLTIGGARLRGSLDESCIRDLLRGFFVIPFSHFDEAFLVAVHGVRKLRSGDQETKKRQKDKAGQILFGIVMSIPVLIIVLPMLAAADESFSAFTGGISEFCLSLTQKFFEALLFGDFLLNLLVFLGTFYFFGLFYGAFHAKVTKTKKLTGGAGAAVRIPFTVMMSFSAAVCGVYVLFFLVKFSDILTKAFSHQQSFVYSEYARQGFFELCFIAVINFMLFYFIKVFSDGENRMVKRILSLLSVETLGFIILAFSKMCLYISVYGFTFKRVFTSWFMAVLFVSFSRLFYCTWKRGNAIKPAVIFASVTFLLLAYSNMEVWMHQANLMMGFL